MSKRKTATGLDGTVYEQAADGLSWHAVETRPETPDDHPCGSCLRWDECNGVDAELCESNEALQQWSKTNPQNPRPHNAGA